MLILGIKGFRSVKLLSLKVIKFTGLCRVGTVSVRVKFRDFVDWQHLRFIFAYHL